MSRFYKQWKEEAEGNPPEGPDSWNGDNYVPPSVSYGEAREFLGPDLSYGELVEAFDEAMAEFDDLDVDEASDQEGATDGSTGQDGGQGEGEGDDSGDGEGEGDD